MLDVHPPHAPTHTWKDFFIHIATIVIGLIIAVGLEQAVEALHNRHLREDLREQLDEQNTFDRKYVQTDIKLAEAYLDWATTESTALRTSRPAAPLHLSRLPLGEFLFPDTGVWLSAKDNGRTGLLLPIEQVWYSDLYRMEQRSFAPGIGALDRLHAALSALDQVLLDDGIAGPDLDLGGFTAGQRTDCAKALTLVLESSRNLERELVVYDAANGFLFRDHNRWDDNYDYLQIREQDYAAHPRSGYIFAPK